MEKEKSNQMKRLICMRFYNEFYSRMLLDVLKKQKQIMCDKRT